MPTQSDVPLMENYSSASQNRRKKIISERLLPKPSSPATMFQVNVRNCPEVREENNNEQKRGLLGDLKGGSA